MSDVKRMVQLRPSGLMLAEQGRSAYKVQPEVGETLEDVLKPSYWVHVAKRLRQFDRVEVTPPSLAYWAEILVTKIARTSTGINIPTFVVINHIDFAAAAESANDGEVFDVAWKGPQMKWAVIRRSDGEVVERGLAAKEDAAAAALKLAA